MQQAVLAQAVTILKKGGLVAFPTETVYGLGADASHVLALNKVFQAKKRPKNHPLILHIGHIDVLSQWVVDVPTEAQKLIQAFWPGPLTLILEKAAWVPEELTGGQNTIGVRMPSHPIALALLQQFGNGLAAPSANQFGHVSPTNAAAVHEELGDAVDLILDGGDCEVGIESTIIDGRRSPVKILRPGMITAREIAALMPLEAVADICQRPRVSGSHDAHYAPRTPTMLIDLNNAMVEQLLKSRSTFVLLTWSKQKIPSSIPQVAMPDEPKAYARILYKTLREIDHQDVDKIYIEDVPHEEAWVAIRDRLRRASYTCPSGS